MAELSGAHRITALAVRGRIRELFADAPSILGTASTFLRCTVHPARPLRVDAQPARDLSQLSLPPDLLTSFYLAAFGLAYAFRLDFLFLVAVSDLIISNILPWLSSTLIMMIIILV